VIGKPVYADKTLFGSEAARKFPDGFFQMCLKTLPSFTLEAVSKTLSRSGTGTAVP
jgi:hypothetical protein